MKNRNVNRHVFTLALLFFSTICNYSYALNVIVDLGDVLLETDEKQLVWRIGPYHFAQYALSCLISEGWCNVKDLLQRRLFTFLELLQPLDESAVPVTYDGHGMPLPPLLRDWLTGEKSLKTIHNLVKRGFVEERTFFLNETEHILIKKITDIMFNPHRFIETRSRILPMWEFIRSCKAEGHKIFIRSNWDAPSYELLKKKYPALSLLIDGEIISGKVKLLKPDMAIYRQLIEEYNLDPSVSIVIDDQPENLIMAQLLGMKTFRFNKKSPIKVVYEWFKNLQETNDPINITEGTRVE